MPEPHVPGPGPGLPLLLQARPGPSPLSWAGNKAENGAGAASRAAHCFSNRQARFTWVRNGRARGAFTVHEAQYIQDSLNLVWLSG